MVSGREHDLIIELAREAGLSPNLNYEANSFPELFDDGCGKAGCDRFGR